MMAQWARGRGGLGMAGGSLVHPTRTPKWEKESELCLSISNWELVYPPLQPPQKGWETPCLTLYPDLLQLCHLRNGLLQVLHKLLHLV